MGSVTEALLRMIDRPTLIIGPHAGRPGPFDGRVVAGIDGSPESEQAIEPARHWAEALDRPLWLIQVTDPTRTAADILLRDVVESGTSRRLPGMRAAVRTGTCSTPSRRHGRRPTSPRPRAIPSHCS
jgi:nucleotide-binding universal stress UspA family protein